MAFIRWKTNRAGGPQAYLVESYRENGKSKQRTLAYLGDAASLTAEHIAELNKRYPDQKIDWEAIKPRKKPLTDPATLSDADLLRKMKHLRMERDFGVYHAAWRLRDAGLKDFHKDKLLALEKAFAGIKTPTETPDPQIIAALRQVYATGGPVVPKKVEPVQQISAPQLTSHPSASGGQYPPGWKPPAQVDHAALVHKTEDNFFQALRERNAAALQEILSDDFVMVDVFRGGETDKRTFAAAMASDGLHFEVIERRDSRLRLYKDTAVIVGETRMAGQLGGTPFDVRSRYTHVYIQTAGAWKLVSAQATPIT